jgi:hypothetical protein
MFLFFPALKPPAHYQPYVDSQVTKWSKTPAMADSDSASEGASESLVQHRSMMISPMNRVSTS